MIEYSHIESLLTTADIGRTVHGFDVIDSTNTYAKQLDRTKAPHGTVIIAEEQTAGRGRLQRNWMAAKGENLLFSVLLYPSFATEKIALLPFAGSLAVADAIEEVTGLSPTCKWPNDVLIDHRKVCGMLLESVSAGGSIERIVLGIGVNVNQTEFPEELRFKASSLRTESGREVDRPALLAAILNALELRYEQLSSFAPDRLLNDWRMKALLFGKKILVLESEISYAATAIDVAEDGSLIIAMEDGTKRHLFAGDVSLAYK
ncbi:MAG: biotin--[acetyl-CoA-carboxylase] ligase [Bacteroidetes bacterium]|nr:biotin--[acetyl-CoA-carboxylase] ligase [Bacteroidota bacterium]